MKTKKNKSMVLRKVAVIATAALAVLLVAAIPVKKLANFIKEKNAASAISISESQFDVQYIGASNNAYNFSVKFENNTAQKLALLIKNDEGKVLYHKKFNNEHFADTIQIVKDENTDYHIYPSFEVRRDNQLVKRSFSIEKENATGAIVKNL